ncbi:MAG: OmpA family protein [Bacteroidia bacterium]|nr:OmpA family protein [Bacteroidia bacterium]
MFRLFSTIVLCISLYPAFSQVAYWQKLLGGTAYDNGRDMLLMADGGLVIAGELASSDKLGRNNHGAGEDVFLGKYATQGVFFWQHTLGGPGPDRVSDINLTQDGGVIMVGTSSLAGGDIAVSHGGEDVWVVKIDPAGNLLWSRSFGGRGDDRGITVIETSDGGFLVGGESTSRDGDMHSPHHGGLDAWLVRLNSGGRLIWEKHYGGPRNEKINRILEVAPDSFLVLASTDGIGMDVQAHLGKKDAWLFTVNGRGQLGWQQVYGGQENDELHELIRDSEGNFVMAGTSFSANGHIPFQRGLGDAWLLKIAPDGVVLWSVTYGGRRPDGFSGVAETADGGFIVCGQTESPTGDGDIEKNNGYFDAWLMKINTYGERQWARTIGYEARDVLYTVLEAPKGGFLAFGSSVQDPAGIPEPGVGGFADMWLINISDPKRLGVRPYITPPLLSGNVTDKTTGAVVTAQITLTDNATLDSLALTQAEPDSGKFVLLLPTYGLVSINVLAPGYLFYGQDIRLDSVISDTQAALDIRLEPIRIGSTLILKNIYFDVGKWELLPASFAELERVVAFLTLNPRVQIQISGHTDNTGNKTEAVALSLNRANAVRTYLKEAGIADARLKVKGYGMYRPIAPNTTPDGRQKNRRVEFEVINM